jgi:hypothetical protein
MKLHVNCVHLVLTVQSVVGIVLMCAANVHLELTMMNLVSFDYDNIKHKP